MVLKNDDVANKSLKDLSKGVPLGRAADVLDVATQESLKSAVLKNVQTIKIISPSYYEEIAGGVFQSFLTGNGLQDLVPFFQKYEGIDARQARELAGEQNKRLYNSLNFIRLQKSGVKKYAWIYAGWGSPSCESHEAMNGKIYSFDDPPIIDPKTGQKGKPGDLDGCNCSVSPIISFD